MRLHAYRHHDGALELIADAAVAAGAMPGVHDLGIADVDLAALSPRLVLGIGLEARGVARGPDALVVEHALAVRDLGLAR